MAAASTADKEVTAKSAFMAAEATAPVDKFVDEAASTEMTPWLDPRPWRTRS